MLWRQFCSCCVEFIFFYPAAQATVVLKEHASGTRA
jgi:hypothetical protein